MSLSVLLRTKNVSDKRCKGNQNTILCTVFFFFFESCAVYEIRLKNVVDPDRPQMAKRRIRFACWILKATDANSEYVILIAFTRLSVTFISTSPVLFN